MSFTHCGLLQNLHCDRKLQGGAPFSVTLHAAGYKLLFWYALMLFFSISFMSIWFICLIGAGSVSCVNRKYLEFWLDFVFWCFWFSFFPFLFSVSMLILFTKQSCMEQNEVTCTVRWVCRVKFLVTYLQIGFVRGIY